MIFVTPDGERTMYTYLGACVEFGPEDVDAQVVAGSKVTYFEGYLWDPPRQKMPSGWLQKLPTKTAGRSR